MNRMTNKKYHQKNLDQHIKTVLDRSVDDLDEDTRYQLQMMRAKVLETKPKRNFFAKWPVFGGIATFASISMLAIFLFVNKPQFQSGEGNMLELDAVFFEADTSLELYEQYDFYVWLSEQEFKG